METVKGIMVLVWLAYMFGVAIVSFYQLIIKDLIKSKNENRTIQSENRTNQSE